MHRTLFVVVLVVGQIDSLFGDTPNAYDPPEVGKVRIVRDKFGVPHIIARSNRDMFFGVGFAQAQDQLENLAHNYLLSEGRGSEFLGPRHMPLDHFTRSLGLSRLAKEGYGRLTPDERDMLTAFANGINAYIEQHKGTIPDWIEPAEPHDTLALAMYVNSMFVMGDCQQDLWDKRGHPSFVVTSVFSKLPGFATSSLVRHAKWMGVPICCPPNGWVSPFAATQCKDGSLIRSSMTHRFVISQPPR